MYIEQSGNFKALTSLALMDSQLLADDYLSTYLPFIATLTLKKKYKAIHINIIVKDFKDEYGISIPHAPMKSILSKAVTVGLITNSQDGTFSPITLKMQAISFAAQQLVNNAEIDSLLDSFISFAKENYEAILDKNKAVDIFIAFLDEYSPHTISGQYFRVDSESSEQFASNRNLFLMGEFIQFMAKINQCLFEIIQKLSMAYLITTALTFDEPVENRRLEFSDLTIYLDTPVVLRLMGLQSDDLKRAYIEMFATFKATINPRFVIFQHTLDEISGIIGDCANWIDNAAYNPSYANPALLNFIKKNFSKTQVELYKATLDTKLQELGIEIDEQEYYNVINHKTQIRNEKLKEKLIEAYTKNNPSYNVLRNQNSLEYDIKSIDYIVKMWGTKSSRSYKRLGYLFITSNATLAFVCRKFSSEYWWDGKKHKSPCMTDYYLGTMIWLSTPASKIENMSKLKLMADCSAATALSKEVMEKFTASLEKFCNEKGVKNSDYLILRKYAYENNYLQNRTLNEETAYNDGTLEEILEDIKLEIQKPLLDTIGDREKQINDLKVKSDEQDCLIKELKGQKEQEQRRREEEDADLEKKTNETVTRIINTYAPIVLAAFIFITFVLQFVPFFSKWHPVIKGISAIASLGSVVLVGSLKSDLGGIKSNISTKIKKYYRLIEK